ncbi:MAG: type II secretion system GspH family protein [Candidatus Pacebacteria bacterium]|nr:type II secretion system GspH family protein [Candidatus Paceibacterota bacterium]
MVTMRARKHAFTLTELLVASTIVVVLLSALTPLAIFVVTTSAKARVTAEMDSQIKIAQEWGKKDLASTARGEILMWPESSSGAYCLSFPVLRRSGSPTGLPVTANNEIDWDETIIYHISYNWDDAARPMQLRRTVFSPRDNSLEDMQRLYQLFYTWYYGDGSRSMYNAGNATTQVLLDNVTNWRISSEPAEFDAYSDSQDRETVPMGTWTISSGTHYLYFTITGKNDEATDFQLGLDKITMSATGLSYEAEYLLPPAGQSGATASQEDMSAYPGWSNKSQLLFAANDPGDRLILRVYNDMWVESTFDAPTAELNLAEIALEATLGEKICQMIGDRISWEASVQSLGAEGEADTTSHENATLRIIVNPANDELGQTIAYNGQRGAVTLAATNGTGNLSIESAYIMERTSGYNGDATTMQQLTFSGSTSVGIPNKGKIQSDVFDLAIDKNKSYIVSLHLGASSGNGSPMVWNDTSGAVHTYEIVDDATNVSGVADWSSIPAEDIMSLSKIVAVESIYVTYPTEATFTSQIVDTRLVDPPFVDLKWRAVTTANDDVHIRVRAGDQPDMSDAATWDTAPEFTNAGTVYSLSALPRGRFLQWQAVFHSTAPYTSTAKLRDVAIRWHGAYRGVDISVAVEKNSDMGKFRLLLDGQDPAPAALEMRYTISRQIKGETFRKSCAVQATPRNK